MEYLRVYEKILFIFILFNFYGCASLPYEKAIALRHTPKEYYSFDLSSGPDVAKLIIQARPPAEQGAVKNYSLIIDNYDPLIVSKHSDTDIIIDAGKHTLKFYVPSGGVFGEVFGKPTFKEIDVRRDEVIIFEYTGPYWAFSEGKVRNKFMEEVKLGK